MKIINANMVMGYESIEATEELMARIAQAFEQRGIETTAITAKIDGTEKRAVWQYQIRNGNKVIYIEEVYRSNSTEHNTSARIELIEWNENHTGKRLERVKITKDAGERSINNKINKILEKF